MADENKPIDEGSENPDTRLEQIQNAAEEMKAEIAKKKDPSWFQRNLLKISLIFLSVVGISVWVFAYLHKLQQEPDFAWGSMKMVALYVIGGIFVTLILVFLILIKFARTRIDKEKSLHANPDINDWLVIFNWTKKIFYIHAIIGAFIASTITLLLPEYQAEIGTLWFILFAICFCIEEFQISGKIVIITVIVLIVLSLLLIMLGEFVTVIKWFAELNVSASPLFYVLWAFLHIFAIAASYVRGLFIYISIEPNQMNIQTGLGQDGDSIPNDKYGVKVVSSEDIIEWLCFGVGKIIVSFPGSDKLPIICRVGRIKTKAKFAEAARGVTAIDQQIGRSVKSED